MHCSVNKKQLLSIDQNVLPPNSVDNYLSNTSQIILEISQDDQKSTVKMMGNLLKLNIHLGARADLRPVFYCLLELEVELEGRQAQKKVGSTTLLAMVSILTLVELQAI